jgi:hypothetical protein
MRWRTVNIAPEAARREQRASPERGLPQARFQDFSESLIQQTEH